MFAAVVRHGILVTVIALIVVILGIAAALRIPVQMIPDLEVRTITVETGWPGATPQDIEKDIVIEQERYLRNVPNLDRMVSTSASGSAEIELEFPFGTDVTQALIEVNNALSQVSDYPRNVDEPRYGKMLVEVSGGDQLRVVWMTSRDLVGYVSDDAQRSA